MTGRDMIEALLESELSDAETLKDMAKTHREIAEQMERDAAIKERFVALTRRTTPHWSDEKCNELARRGDLAAYVPS